MGRRRNQQPQALSAGERARIETAVSTALATIDRSPNRRPSTDMITTRPPRFPDDTDNAEDEKRGGGWRSLAHRNRRQFMPWLVAAAVGATGTFAALLGWLLGPDSLVGWITMAACGTAALVALVLTMIRKVHPYWASWLLLCITAGGAWISLVAYDGLTYPHFVALIAGTAVLGLRWWRHVRHRYPTSPYPDRSDLGDEPARLMQDWAENAGCLGGPVAGARLLHLRPYEHGYTGEVQLVRGKQSLGDVHAALPRLSTALDVAPENLIVESPTGLPPSRLRLQIVTRSPVREPVLFDEPTYTDGRILLGPYADGLGHASYVLYTEDSIESGYVLGSKGSGKSRVLETVALTAIACTPTVIIYIDGQNGASSPLLWQHALWHSGPDQAATVLDALIAIMRYRQLYLRRYGLYGFTPSPELPGVQVIVDECHKIFTEHTNARWADIAREGRKLGVAILAASQVATLDAFGGGQHADALRSSLVASNGIALRTASKVQSSVFPGLSVDLMALPRLPGYGYTVDDGDDQHRTAPFRNRWLIGADQAARRGDALPGDLCTAEEWFAAVADNQRLDQRSAQAAGPAFLNRHADAARERAELERLFDQPDSQPETRNTTSGSVVPFPQLAALPDFEPTPAEPPRPTGDEAPSGLTDAQYAVWDTVANGVHATADIATTLGLSQRRVQVVVGQLLGAGHLTKTGHGRYTTSQRHQNPA